MIIIPMILRLVADIHGKIVEYQGLRILGWRVLAGIMAKEFNIPKQMWWQVTKLWPRLKFGDRIDIVLTHNPALGLNDGKGHAHCGFKSFRYLIDTFSPRYFLHGHQHLSYAMRNRIIHYKDTEIINAYEYHVLEI